jgi:hypothetical protein
MLPPPFFKRLCSIRFFNYISILITFDFLPLEMLRRTVSSLVVKRRVAVSVEASVLIPRNGA